MTWRKIIHLSVCVLSPDLRWLPCTDPQLFFWALEVDTWPFCAIYPDFSDGYHNYPAFVGRADWHLGQTRSWAMTWSAALCQMCQVWSGNFINWSILRDFKFIRWVKWGHNQTMKEGRNVLPAGSHPTWNVHYVHYWLLSSLESQDCVMLYPLTTDSHHNQHGS